MARVRHDAAPANGHDARVNVLSTPQRVVGGLALALSLSSPAACAAPGVASAPAASAPPSRPPVVVTIVVDQLAAWVAAERFDALPPGGGFARLRNEGTWVRRLRYEHAATDTAPGHSALYTGAVPAVSGVYANEVLGASRKPESILRDEATKVISADGPLDRPGSSLAPLQVETLADRLRAEVPGAVIVSLSLKDRGALFGGGRHPTASLWLDTQDNRFVSTSSVTMSLPAWARAPLARSVAAAEAATWTPLDPAWLAAHALTPDAEAGEGEVPGFGTTFPHRLASAARPALALRTSPEADELLLDLGLAALDAEHVGHGGHPLRTTLLALSLSSNDYIGHTFGPDSWEAWDELARLDAALGRFLAALDARLGTDGYAVVLTGDHGIAPMPEAGRHAYCDAPTPDLWGRPCGVERRVFAEPLASALAAAANDALGVGDWVFGVSDPYVYLTRNAVALDASRRASLDAALAKALEAYPGVARALPIGALPAACPPFADESLEALVCRSVAPAARARGASFYVALEPGSFFDPSVVVGKGASHGSPYLFDRTVPLLVRAPGRVAAGVVVDEATFDLFASTAAALLRIGRPRDASLPAISLDDSR
jgi:hypothetical protein